MMLIIFAEYADIVALIRSPVTRGDRGSINETERDSPSPFFPLLSGLMSPLFPLPLPRVPERHSGHVFGLSAGVGAGERTRIGASLEESSRVRRAQ